MSECDNTPANECEKSADDARGTKRHPETENVRIVCLLVFAHVQTVIAVCWEFGVAEL